MQKLGHTCRAAVNSSLRIMERVVCVMLRAVFRCGCASVRMVMGEEEAEAARPAVSETLDTVMPHTVVLDRPVVLFCERRIKAKQRKCNNGLGKKREREKNGYVRTTNTTSGERKNEKINQIKSSHNKNKANEPRSSSEKSNETADVCHGKHA